MSSLTDILLRTYCYVSYCKREDAEKAIRQLNNFEIRPGFYLAVTKSVDNRKLVMKPSLALAATVTEEAVREELQRILEGVVAVRFISTRWMEVDFLSHKLAAVARRMIVPGELTIFQKISIRQICCLSDIITGLSVGVQVDWADPDIEGYVTELMNNRKLCLKDLPRGFPDCELRKFFNKLAGSHHGNQVENIARTKNNQVIVTFLSPEAAKTVMERGEGLEVGGVRVKISWWLDREVYSSQPWQGSKPVSLDRQEEPQVQVQQEQVEGPVEKLHKVSLSQNWGVPRYTVRSFLNFTGQQLF